MMKKAYLVLQNGRIFEGIPFGAEGDVTAELVFTTGMTGYIETLTDPSYHGQIVLQTFPLVGNYGIIPDDFESPAPKLSAYIVREPCDEPSNFRSEGTLDDYLKHMGVVGLYGVDTRALTKIIREYGTMNASVLSQLPDSIAAYTKDLAARALSGDVYAVSCRKPFAASEEGTPHIVLWDFGFKGSIAGKLAARGCKVTVVPAASTPADILAQKPDGILLSNGPGDPSVYTDIIKNLRELPSSNIPVFGICLGHQLLALAKGARSIKLKYGHHGANQPVRDTKTGKLYITSQNHEYSIDPKTLPEGAVMSYENVNDGTCEGISYSDIPAFSVQFHPEASAGPQDTEFLFDQFLTMVGGKRNAAQ
ncbi:MAG: carbamoyl phosphate synthase small subunit [Clostridiales bacterium]|nr:carbamoyl phosphate synthase small subunit [Clostridiales bacterium]